MGEHNCEKCKFRARYDKNHESFLGRVWRWHINWCPGWNRYFASLSEDKRAELADQYGLKK